MRRTDGGRWLIPSRRRGHSLSAFVAGIEQELTVFVPPEDPVKLAVLTLKNTSPFGGALVSFGYVEWCLGPPRTGERRFVVTEMDDVSAR
jgi:cyclic beta-1,2-glucan synthetase